jgi:hypothetical protein
MITANVTRALAPICPNNLVDKVSCLIGSIPPLALQPQAPIHRWSQCIVPTTHLPGTWANSSLWCPPLAHGWNTIYRDVATASDNEFGLILPYSTRGKFDVQSPSRGLELENVP